MNSRIPLLVVIFILSIGFIFIFSKFQIGLTHDSGYYIIAAKTFAQSGEMRDIHGNPLTLMPPLYPLLLSASFLLKINVFYYAAFLNLALSIISILLTFQIIKEEFKDRKFTWLCLISIGLSATLLMNTLFLWTECLFIFFIQLNILFTWKYRQTLRSYYLILLIFFSICACYTRYIGIFLIPAISITLLTQLNSTKKNRWITCIIYAFSTTLFVSIWIARNYFIAGQISSYEPATKSFLENIFSFLSVTSTFFIPGNSPDFLKVLLGTSIVVLFTIISIKGKSFFIIPLIFFWSYLVTFCLLNSLRNIVDFDDRYLSPVYIPCILLFICSAEWIYNKLNSVLLRKSIIAILFLWLIYPTYRFIKNISFWNEHGLGYSNGTWQENEIIEWDIRRRARPCLISDNPIPFILFGSREVYSLDYLKHHNPTYCEIVLWKNGETLGYLTTSIKSIQENYTVKKIQETKEVELYEATLK